MTSDYEYEKDYWNAVQAVEDMYNKELNKHPNCKDPDHPGCSKCEGDNNE